MTSQRLSELRHKGYITEEEYQKLKTNPGKERYISETNLRKWIITDGCVEGHGYIDESDINSMEWEKV